MKVYIDEDTDKIIYTIEKKNKKTDKLYDIKNFYDLNISEELLEKIRVIEKKYNMIQDFLESIIYYYGDFIDFDNYVREFDKDISS